MEAQLLFVLVTFAFVAISGCGAWCARRKRVAEIELRAPLLLTVAREGCRVCQKCSFENLQHSAFCAICGAVFAESERRNGGGLTARQRRVQRRKRWVRSVVAEEDGSSSRVRWQDTVADSVSLEAWVLRLTALAQEDEIVDDATSPEEPQAAQNDVVITVDNDDDTDGEQVDPLAMTAARLEASVAQLTVVFEDATVADAAVSSLTIRHANSPGSTPTEQRQQEIRDAVSQAQLDFPTKLAQFITASSTLFLNATTRDDGSTRSSRLTIDRAYLLRDSVAAIATLTPTEARAAVRVEFVGDQGIDAGGVYREWFLLFNEQAIQPEAGIFVCVDRQEQTFYLNPHSREVLGEHHLAHFLAAGRVLGRALLEGNVTGFHLAHPLLKIILGLPVGLEDLEHFDPETHKNLQWLLENDGADSLGLDFTVVEKRPDGTTRSVDLVPRGGDVDVTDANKRAFVSRKLAYLLVESVAQQLVAFLTGVYEVVPAELLMLFDVEELDFILSGSDAIDVDDWQRHCKYTPDLVDHPALKHFWQLVREMTPEQRQLLLQFATGSSRVPPAGFAALSSYDGRLCPFTLYGVGAWQDCGYVRSHACFNRLDLPRLRTKKGLKQALTAALLSEDTGFTIQ